MSFPISKKHCEEQTQAWESFLLKLYEGCRWSEFAYFYTSMALSTLIVVLNVIVVGADVLDINALTVSIFMVVVSVVKAVQLKYKFDVVKEECHIAKEGLRDTLLEVRKLRKAATKSSYDGSEEEFVRVETGVVNAVQAVPSFISIDSRALKLALKRTGDDTRSPKQLLESLKSPNSQGAGGRGWGVFSTNSPEAGDKEAPLPGARPERSEATHGAPDEGKPKTEEAEAGVDEPEHNRQLTTNIVRTIDHAVKKVHRAAWLYRLANSTFTCLELTLNVVILSFSSISSLSGMDREVSVLASVNVVVKALQMKLSLDVEEAAAMKAYVKFRTFQEKAMKLKTQQHLATALKGDDFLAKEDFDDLVFDLETLIIAYAEWLEWQGGFEDESSDELLAVAETV